MRRVAILLGVAETDPEAQSRVDALRQELERLGWIEGRNLRIEQRWTGGDAERLRGYTAELVASAPDVIVANPTSSIAALKEATRTIPVVFALLADPVSSGFVGSWARPGGNITGFTSFEASMAGKWLEALKQMAPRVTQVAPRVTQVALVFNPDTAASGGTRRRLPALYPFRFFATSGGLMSYGIDTLDVFRRAASYVDRVLKGAHVGELPVQGPTKFELAINLKTAEALGLSVPASLLALADEVIE